MCRPDLCVAALEDIDLDALAEAGIRGLLLDRDKTLTSWRSREISHAKREWIEAARGRFRLCIVSNTIFKGGVRAIAAGLGIPAVCRWGLGRKPLPGGIRAALREIEVGPQEAAIIGDQLFTDVLGGNLVGLHTILVEPVPGREFLGTRLTRVLEAAVAKRLGLKPRPGANEG